MKKIKETSPPKLERISSIVITRLFISNVSKFSLLLHNIKIFVNYYYWDNDEIISLPALSRIVYDYYYDYLVIRFEARLRP